MVAPILLLGTQAKAFSHGPSNPNTQDSSANIYVYILKPYLNLHLVYDFVVLFQNTVCMASNSLCSPDWPFNYLPVDF